MKLQKTLLGKSQYSSELLTELINSKQVEINELNESIKKYRTKNY